MAAPLTPPPPPLDHTAARERRLVRHVEEVFYTLAEDGSPEALAVLAFCTALLHVLALEARVMGDDDTTLDTAYETLQATFAAVPPYRDLDPKGRHALERLVGLLQRPYALDV